MFSFSFIILLELLFSPSFSLHSLEPTSQSLSSLLLTHPPHLFSSPFYTHSPHPFPSLSNGTQHKEPDYSSKMFPKALDTTIDFLKQVSMLRCPYLLSDMAHAAYDALSCYVKSFVKAYFSSDHSPPLPRAVPILSLLTFCISFSIPFRPNPLSSTQPLLLPSPLSTPPSFIPPSSLTPNLIPPLPSIPNYQHPLTLPSLSPPFLPFVSSAPSEGS